MPKVLKMAQSEYEQLAKERDNVISGQFDTATFLQNLAKILKGFVYDDKQKKYVVVPEEGYLNHIGSRQVLNEVEGRVQNIQGHAYLRRAEIANMRQGIWFIMCKKLFVNHDLFDLHHVNFKNVLCLLDDNILNFFSRTEESRFFDKFPNFFQRKETVSQYYAEKEPEQQKRRLSI